MQSETITLTKRRRVQWVTLCDLVAGITQQCEVWRDFFFLPLAKMSNKYEVKLGWELIVHKQLQIANIVLNM